MNKKTVSIFLISLLIFVGVSFLVYKNSAISDIEVNIIKFIQSSLKGIALSIPKTITYFGHEKYWLYTVIFVSGMLFAHKRFVSLAIFALSLPCSEYIYSFFKSLIERPRPPIDLRLIEVGKYSFPSGHSTLSMVTYGLLIYFVCKYVQNRILKGILITILSLLIISIGFTRVWLGVHFPTDVIGGFALGLCIVFLCIWVLEFFKIFKN